MALLSVIIQTQNNSKLVRTFVKTVELLLLSTGLLTTLAVVKRAVLLPHSCDIVFTSLLGFWTTVKCFLSSPLSICIFIHLMVLMIAASSALHRRVTDDDAVVHVDSRVRQFAESLIASPPSPAPPPVVGATTPPTSGIGRDENHQQLVIYNLYSDEKNVTEDPILLHMLQAREIKKMAEPVNYDSSHRTGEFLVKDDHPPLPNEWKDVYVENEDDNTMDATWKAITGGGKEKPKKKNLKKSETWDHVPPRRRSAVQRLDSEELLPTTPKWKELRKSETFNDAVSMSRRGGLRRDPSMSIEEFNMQVEAFIKKFNDNMRLQRQESKKRFFDTVNGGF